jgi:hypothetical protein
MHTETTTQNHYLRAAVVFGLSLAMVFLLQPVGHLLHSSFLFFAPQLIFPYEGLVVRGTDSYHYILSHTVALTLSFVQWALVYFCFAWFARRLSVFYTILAAIGIIIILCIATNIGLGLFGVRVALDGQP